MAITAPVTSALVGRVAPMRRICKFSCFRKQDTLLFKPLISLRTFSSNGRNVPSALPYEYFATCHPGLEAVVADELNSANIGASDVTIGKSGVSFTGQDPSVGYAANLWLRSAIRVLALLAESPLDPRVAAGEEVYYAFRESARWQDIIPRGCTFTIKARVHGNTQQTFTHLVTVRGKDAICDALRDARGEKPDPPLPGETADVPLYVTLYRDHMRVYRDMSGASLHRRGYRTIMHRASLNESAAAGILQLAGWKEAAQQGVVLADPMCGSGTLLIEAALLATNTAVGLFRHQWPFHSWPDFNLRVWQQALDKAEGSRSQWQGRALGNDCHEGALGLAKRDAASAGVSHYITFNHDACADWTPMVPPSLVVCNPPWGQRLGGDEDGFGRGDGTMEVGSRGGAGRRFEGGMVRSHDRVRYRGDTQEQLAVQLKDTYEELGDFLKDKCGGATAYLLSGNKAATHGLHMRADAKFPLTIGGVDCRLIKYSVRARMPREQVM